MKKIDAITCLAQTRLGCFAELAFGWLHPERTFNHHWPLEVLADALTQCRDGKIKRLIINMPPRSLKSFYASVAFPAWVLAHRPDARIMCVAGSRGLAEDQAAMSRRMMTHPGYRAVFPHVRLSDTNQAIRLKHGGSRSAHVASPGGGITGRGADIVIIDDPLGASYADDDDRREAVNRWYDQNVYQRLDNKQDGIIIVVMQRLHVNDLTGHLLKQEGWEVLSLPSVATTGEAYTLTDGKKVGRKAGAAFHPERESRDQLRKLMRQIGAKAFMAQYQQSPYAPGKGEGFHGAHHWLVPVGPEMPGIGDTEMAFLNVSQERLVDAEIFQAPSPLPMGVPGLRPMTNEEWAEWAGRQPCSSA